MFYLLLSISLLYSTENTFKSDFLSQSYPSKSLAQEEQLLINIQKKIKTTFLNSMQKNSDQGIKELATRLDAIYEKTPLNTVQYWRAYLNYYHAIYHLEQNDKNRSEKLTNQAIEMIQSLKNKTAEDLVLLAFIKSFSIQFKGIQAMFISMKISHYLKKAVAMDSENLRVYYVLGSQSFYTPEKYGGGKDVEKHLVKAISLPSQKLKNPVLPSWGKMEAYVLLVRYFIKKENWEKAKQYYLEGIEKFPRSYALNQLEVKLKK